MSTNMHINIYIYYHYIYEYTNKHTYKYTYINRYINIDMEYTFWEKVIRCTSRVKDDRTLLFLMIFLFLSIHRKSP